MDPTFHSALIEELQTLLSEIQAGVQESNPVLAAAVRRVVREQTQIPTT